MNNQFWPSQSVRQIHDLVQDLKRESGGFEVLTLCIQTQIPKLRCGSASCGAGTALKSTPAAGFCGSRDGTVFTAACGRLCPAPSQSRFLAHPPTAPAIASAFSFLPPASSEPGRCLGRTMKYISKNIIARVTEENAADCTAILPSPCLANSTAQDQGNMRVGHAPLPPAIHRDQYSLLRTVHRSFCHKFCAHRFRHRLHRKRNQNDSPSRLSPSHNATIYLQNHRGSGQ